MEKYRQITLHGEPLLLEQSAPPTCHRENVVGRELEITVIFTSTEATLAAIDRVGVLLSGLGGRISLVDAEIVPYPLPLDNPPVALDFTERRLVAIANQSMFDVTVSMYLCRSRLEALLAVLKRSSIVIIGCGGCGRYMWEKKVAKELQKAGIQTILLEDRHCAADSGFAWLLSLPSLLGAEFQDRARPTQ